MSTVTPNNNIIPTCPICYVEIPEGTTPIQTSCGHVFDEACISRWLQTNNSCPNCRTRDPLPENHSLRGRITLAPEPREEERNAVRFSVAGVEANQDWRTAGGVQMDTGDVDQDWLILQSLGGNHSYAANDEDLMQLFEES